MKDKFKFRIVRGVPYVISFICGILFLLIILKFRGYVEAEAYVEVSPSIAIVNQDVVGDTYDFSFGDKIASMFLDNSEYNFVLTNYQDATEGVKGYAYSGYILIDSNFTNSMYSINEEIPTKGLVSYRINSNLEDSESQSVEDYILSQLYVVNNNINYIYITSILEVIHGSQDNVADILSNEDEVDSILTNIDDYNSRYYKSSEEFLKELNENKGEEDIGEAFEIDPNSLIDIEYNIDDLVKLGKEVEEEYESGLIGNVSELGNIYSEYGKMIMEGNFDINEISYDESYLEFLNSTVDKLIKLDKGIKLSHIAYDGVDSLDLTQYVTYVEFIDELYLDTIPDQNNKGDIVHFSSSMNILRDEFQDIIVDFVKNYHYWITNVDQDDLSRSQVCLDLEDYPIDPSDPDYSKRYNCMNEFKYKYKDKLIVQDYITLKNWYLKISDFVGTNTYADIVTKYDEYVEFLDNSTYTDFVSNVPFGTFLESYTEIQEVCNSLDESQDIVIGFSCDLEDTLTWLLSDSVNVYQSSKEEILNELVLQDVEIAKLMGNRENGLIDNYLNTVPTLSSAVTSGLGNIISEEGISSIESTIDGMQETNQGLEDTIVDNEVSNQENINKLTKSFKETYPELTSGLDENSDLLYEFATLFENSNNAEGANYYLYDFVSNPVEVNKESSSEKLIPIERGIDKDKFIALGAVTLSLAISSGIYVDLRKKNKKDKEEEDVY